MTETVQTGVIGHPIGHSKSPLIHHHWISAHGLNASYEAIDIMPQDLESRVRELVTKGYKGFNVTVPHKQRMMDLCDELDDTARAIGAVNTVTIREDDSLYGQNTDAFGFTENLKQGGGAVPADKPAIVLGAGGAARAIVYALLNEGVPEIVLLNRTRENAEELAAHFSASVTVRDWNARGSALENAGLLVNTTSLGMTGKPPLEIDLEKLPGDALVTDIIYAPLMTDLLKQARTRGHKTVTGIGMLLHQARPGFQAWHGVWPEVTEELERKVLA